jgi:hypothetical protein
MIKGLLSNSTPTAYLSTLVGRIKLGSINQGASVIARAGAIDGRSLSSSFLNLLVHQTRRKGDDPLFGLFHVQKGKAFGSGSGCHIRDGDKEEEERGANGQHYGELV